MEHPLLTEQHVFPTEEIIFPYIGKSKALWQSVFEFIHSTYPGFSEQWNYYNDGKCWLLKVTNKSKTVFWLAVLKDTFRISFYFSDKAKEALNNSSISEDLKDQFNNNVKKPKAISIIFKNKKDIEYAKCLMAIKLSIK